MNTLISQFYTLWLLGIPALLTVTHLLVYRELKNIRIELYQLRQLSALQLMIQTRSQNESKTPETAKLQMEPAENVHPPPVG